MTPLRVLAAVVWISCILGACASPEAPEDPVPPEPPNVLLFMVDDLRHDALGATGHPFFQSPRIDRLADEGVIFEDMFVISSLCSPSRATMLTGLYTHQHRVRTIWDQLSPDAPTFAGHLREAGYETAWIGKWHLNSSGAPHPDFDHWVSYRAHGTYTDPPLNVNGSVEYTSGHLTDLLTERALDYLSSPRESPFFLAVSHTASAARR